MRKEIREDQSYLDNSSFADGMDKWKTGSKATLFTLGGRWIWANGGPYGTKPDGHAEIRTDGKVPYAYIRNNYIMQRLKDFRLVPEYRQTNSQGERVPGVVYLSFSYRVIKAGRLKIEFVNADKTGFENFNMFGHEEDLPVGGEKMFTLDGLWNGTGDFKLSFTGVIYISLLVFSTNKADALAYKYRTLFEQSDRLVKISAAVFDKDGAALKETGLVIKPEGAGLYAQDASGKVALIGVSVEDTDEYGKPVSKIKLTADHIQLEGLVTANGNFKILEDGSIEAKNAKIKGYVYSVFKDIDLSDATALGNNSTTRNYEYRLNTNLYIDATFRGVVLPVSEEYEGARVLVMDSHFLKTRVYTDPTTIRTEDGSSIESGLFRQKYEGAGKHWDIYAADFLQIDSGTIELILKNCAILDPNTGAVTSRKLKWILIGSSCQTLSWSTGGTIYYYRYNTSAE